MILKPVPMSASTCWSHCHRNAKLLPWVNKLPVLIVAACLQFTGNQGAYPNFYASYCGDGTHKKPLIITETSAMYNPSDSTGSSDYAIKSNWWQQVFNVQGNSSQGPDMSVNFPMVKAILWFDEIKTEAQAANALIDWRFSGGL